MPHVDIKCFPRELTDEQKTALAADITEGADPPSEQQRERRQRRADSG